MNANRSQLEGFGHKTVIMKKEQETERNAHQVIQ